MVGPFFKISPRQENAKIILSDTNEVNLCIWIIFCGHYTVGKNSLLKKMKIFVICFLSSKNNEIFVICFLSSKIIKSLLYVFCLPKIMKSLLYVFCLQK